MTIGLCTCCGALLLVICLVCYYRVGLIVNFIINIYTKIRKIVFGDPEEYLLQLESLERLEEAFKTSDQYREITIADLVQYGIKSWKTRDHMIKFFDQLFFPEFSEDSNFFPHIRCGNDILNTYFDDHWSKFENMIVQFRGDPDYARKAQAMFRAVHLYTGEGQMIPPIFVSHLEYKKFWNRIFKHYFVDYDKETVKVFKKKIWKTVLKEKINFAYLFEQNLDGLREIVGNSIGKILSEEVFNIHYDGRVDVVGDIQIEDDEDIIMDEDEKFQRRLKNVYLKPLHLNRKHYVYRELLMSHDFSYNRTFDVINNVNSYGFEQLEFFINSRKRFGNRPRSTNEIVECPLCKEKH